MKDSIISVGTGKMQNCGMRKVKCRMDSAKSAAEWSVKCGMLALHAYLEFCDFAAQGSCVCSQGCRVGSVHSLGYCNEENKLKMLSASIFPPACMHFYRLYWPIVHRSQSTHGSLYALHLFRTCCNYYSYENVYRTKVQTQK